jgi:hypothetical protein
MATTPNYGWVTPAPTDFVTDLPADFETFADAVDADLGGLLGGTTGQILTKDSNDDHDFSWQSPAGAGKVLQVVMASTTTIATNTTSTQADTGLTASITPSSATSKVLVLVTENGVRRKGNTTNAGVTIRLQRNGSNIALMSRYALYDQVSYVQSYGETIAINYLDTPNTTSSTTYKTQFSNGIGNNDGVELRDNGEMSTMILLEIAA